MNDPIVELIRRRVSAERFDASRPVPEALLRELIHDATHAPSSFNIQHWRFVAVTGAAERERLREAAYGQDQVTEAPVVLIVLGDTRAAERLSEVMEVTVERGALPPGKAAAWIHMAERVYADPGLARDEALRSASLASMIVMLSAEARGLATSALIGFDPERVRRDFEIDDTLVPVMLLAVGYPAEERTPRKPRLPVSEVLAFGSGRKFRPGR